MFLPELLPFGSKTQVVEGIDEMPGRDGRLLGHFPYAEAVVDQLVPVEAGIELHRDAAISLDAMRRAAAADGVDLRLPVSYTHLTLPTNAQG